jgi:hypothetical protein
MQGLVFPERSVVRIIPLRRDNPQLAVDSIWEAFREDIVVLAMQGLVFAEKFNFRKKGEWKSDVGKIILKFPRTFGGEI